MLNVFFLLLVSVHAGTVSLSTPSATALSAQAQSLALKKDRQGACKLLVSGLEGASLPAKSKAKLTDLLQSISTVFFTDKGQRAFESGQAAMWDSPELAMKELKTAAEIEDMNVRVLASMAKVHLARQECEPALQLSRDARKVNPLDAELALLEMRSLTCQLQWDLFVTAHKKLAPPTEAWPLAFYNFLMAQYWLHEKQTKKAAEILSKVVSEAPNFAEGHWLLARAHADLGRENDVHLQRYVSLCKALTVRERRMFSLEPRMCANLKDAENELVQKNSDI